MRVTCKCSKLGAPPTHPGDRGGHSHVDHTFLILVDGVQLEVGGAKTLRLRRVVRMHNNVHDVPRKGDTLLSKEEEERTMCVCARVHQTTTYLVFEVLCFLLTPTELILVSCTS